MRPTTTTPTPPTTAPSRPPRRRTRLALAAALASALLAGCGALAVTSGSTSLPSATDLPGTTFDGEPDASDGRLPSGGVSPDDASLPGTARLDPDLARAVRTAARAAARQSDITMTITSGWRSKRYQQWLFDQAVERYGSAAAARRYVATPDDSAHTRGAAVDVGPTDAADWLSRHGAAYGLCQVFANEIWHYELLVRPGTPCPPMRADNAAA